MINYDQLISIENILLIYCPILNHIKSYGMIFNDIKLNDISQIILYKFCSCAALSLIYNS